MGNHGTASTLPKNGVEFELTLNGDTTDPIDMLISDGIDPEGWRHEGEKLKGVQTRCFKLVQAGYKPTNLDTLLSELAAHNCVPAEGQWREAFKDAYPTPNEDKPIVFADPSWVDPDGERRFPCLYVGDAGWHSDFVHADRYVTHWRLVVACQKADTKNLKG